MQKKRISKLLRRHVEEQAAVRIYRTWARVEERESMWRSVCTLSGLVRRCFLARGEEAV